ncbi:MAG: peptide chain release factor N(5)-glutamine methyltransferase [Eubacterium sp.]|nr:peptide chain release factor N(5)-glutamine methyltransferase [Eubacterium sp.]
MKIYELQREGTEILKAAGIDNPEYDSKALLKHVFGLSETGLILEKVKEADEELSGRYLEYIRKRSEHYPLQYITHSAGFMDYDFYVAEGVLIPRQDTEILVENALKQLEKDHKDSSVRLLDICTGSGCIGLSCYLSRKTMGVTDDVTLGDISEDALRIAGENARKLSADVSIVRSDIFEAFKGQKDRFDMIVSNPPYIRTDVIPTLMPEVREHEPYIALCGEDDGLTFYRRIISETPLIMKTGGWLFVEIGYDQYEDTRKLFVDNGFDNIRLFKDYAGLDRVVCGQLTKAL